MLENDGYPTNICKNCLNQITNWVNFQQICVNSAKTLHNNQLNIQNLPIDVGNWSIKVEEVDFISSLEDDAISSSSFQAEDDIKGNNSDDIKSKHSHELENTEPNSSELKKKRLTSRVKIKKSLVCHICNRNFKFKCNLKRHMMSHTGEKPRSHDPKNGFICKFCHHRFSFKSNLLRHEMCHTGERRHKCTICNKGKDSSAQTIE